MTAIATPLLIACAPVLLLACDESQAWHAPEPTLARMMDQPRADPYAANGVFADDRAMRMPPEATLARESESPPYFVAGHFVDRIPFQMTRTLLERGRSRFDITCAACHGVVGDGTSVVATKMTLRRPPSLHSEENRALAVGEIEQVIEQGYGLMPSYLAVLPNPVDRWAVVAYVRALQLSQHVDVATLPLPLQRELSEAAP